MNHKNIIELPLEEIRNLYLVEKLSCKEIATRYGVSSPTIRKRLRSLGVEIRKPQFPIYNGKKVNIPIEDLKKLYYEDNWTLEEIAEIYFVTETTIRNYLKAYGLPRRKPGQQKKNLPIDEIKELYLKGNTSSELAEKFNVGGTTILKLLHEQGVQIRNRHSLAKTKEISAEESVYELLCVGCEREAWCHEHCETCDEFEEAMNDE
jgi:DNA-binding transcriptional regulator LsrR (DeoR family)